MANASNPPADLCFLQLTAANAPAVKAFSDEANEALLPPDARRLRKESRSRETTPAFSDRDSVNRASSDVTLSVSFDQMPKDPKVGWTLGSSRTCDIVINHGYEVRMSNKHLVFEVSAQNIISLRDTRRNGTTITYEYIDESKKNPTVKVHNSRRMLYVDGSLGSMVMVTIRDLKFHIQFPSYIRNEGRFRSQLQDLYQKHRDALPGIGLINLGSQPVTAGPSQPGTPAPEQLVCIDRELIGEGISSRVWRVTDTYSAISLATKELKQELITTRAMPGGKRTRPSPGSLHGRFQEEARLMGSLSHKNLISLVAYLEQAERICMPLYRGNLTMFDLSERQCDSMVIQICRALAYLHVNGIVHRDVKPENILVNDQEEHVGFILTDLGLAGRFGITDDDSWPAKRRTFYGTPQYAAPEQYGMASEGYDDAADVWSLGITWFDSRCSFQIEMPREGRPAAHDATFTYLRSINQKAVNLVQEQVERLQSEATEGSVLKMVLNMVKQEPEDRWLAARCLGYCAEHGLDRLVDGPDPVTSEGLERRMPRRPRPLDRNVEEDGLQRKRFSGPDMATVMAPGTEASTQVFSTEHSTVYPVVNAIGDVGPVDALRYPSPQPQPPLTNTTDGKEPTADADKELQTEATTPSTSNLSQYVNTITEEIVKGIKDREQNKNEIQSARGGEKSSTRLRGETTVNSNGESDAESSSRSRQGLHAVPSELLTASGYPQNMMEQMFPAPHDPETPESVDLIRSPATSGEGSARSDPLGWRNHLNKSLQATTSCPDTDPDPLPENKDPRSDSSFPSFPSQPRSSLAL